VAMRWALITRLMQATVARLAMSNKANRTQDGPHDQHHP
jgi:hypothetical protein